MFHLLHANNQIATIFLLSTPFRRARTALAFATLWMIGLSLVCIPVMRVFIGRNRAFVPVLDLIPGIALFHGLYEFSEFGYLSENTGRSGLSFSNIRQRDSGMW